MKLQEHRQFRKTVLRIFICFILILSFFTSSLSYAAGPVDNQAPTVPANVVITSVTGTTAGLSWLASTDNVGVAGYLIYQGNQFVGFSATTSYVATGLTASTSYVFTVKAYDTSGNVSLASNGVGVTTTIMPRIAASSSGNHSLALKTDGTVWAWGLNNKGQLGNNSIIDSNYPVQVNSLTGVTNIASGGLHSMAVKSDGTVWTWGDNTSGQLGVGAAPLYSATPVQVTSLTGMFTSVAGGASHSVALRNDGTVWTWGNNANGQLGNNGTGNLSTPVQVTGITGVTAIAAGGSFTLALKSDGTVWSWGYNANGQLGDGTATQRLVPVPVTGLTNGTAIATGQSHSIALKSDGTVWVWGYNANSQLGNGGTTQAPTPLLVSGLTGIKGIAGGGNHTVTLKSDGTVWSWGNNSNGQLGTGNTVTAGTPIQMNGISGVTAIAGGQNHSILLIGDGSVWSAGSNSNGQLGNGATSATPTAIAVQAAGLQLTQPLSDMQAPNAPANVSAVSVLDSQVSITWTTATDNVGVTAYTIYNGSTLVGTTSGTSYTISGLLPNTSYSITVKARDAAGNVSPASSALAITTIAPDTIAPSVPTNVMITQTTGTSLALSWNASTDNVSVKQYLIYSGSVVVGITFSTSYTITGLQPSTLYSLTVKAQDAAGNASSVSSTLTVSTAALGTFTLPVPTNLTITQTTGNSLTLSWNAPTVNLSIKKYLIYSNSTMVGAADTNSYTITGLQPSSSYTYTVQAQDVVGNLSPISNSVTGVTSINAIAKIAASNYQTEVLSSNGDIWSWGQNSYGQLGNGTQSNSAVPVLVNALRNVISLSSGVGNTYALKNDGTVWSWGDNNYGQLGNGTMNPSLTPVKVINLNSITAISAGTSDAVALKNDGTVWTWGQNSYGQLGDGTVTNRLTPVQVMGLNSVIAISASGYHILALKSDGTVWTWGNNEYGQLGNGTITNSKIPIQVAGLNSVKAVTAGSYQSYAVKNDGTVWSWGSNNFGQLGDGTTTIRKTPTQVNGLNSINSISSEFTFSVALKNDGTVWSWGDNYYGQLGNGTYTRSLTPQQISGLNGIAAVAVGSCHSVALKNDGTIIAWGFNADGELGNGTTTNSALPIQVPNFSLLPDTQAPSTPTSISTTSVMDTQVSLNWTSATDNIGVTAYAIYNGSSLVGVTSGTSYTVVGLSSSTSYSFTVKSQDAAGNLSSASSVLTVMTTAKDTLPPSIPTNVIISQTTGSSLTLSWSASTDNVSVKQYLIYNGSVPIGSTISTSYTISGLQLGTSYSFSIRAQDQSGNLSFGSQTISGMTNLAVVPFVAAGGNHTVSLQADGMVWTWGLNEYGQLGNGTSTKSTTPVQVNGLSGVTSIAAGGNHTVSLKADGTVWTWGINSSGQLGNGTTTNSSIPVQVIQLSGITAIAAGSYHSVALKNDGTVWTWGDNGNGVLGNGTTTQSTIPVQVNGLSSIIAIASGRVDTIALKSDGTVWVWGHNGYGQLGNGTIMDSAVPVQLSGISGVKAISSGLYYFVTLKNDGTVWTWGYNSNGELGNGTTTNSTTPVQVIGLSGITAIAGRGSHIIALKSDGTVWTWGNNSNGQLGNGSYTNSTTPIQVSGVNGIIAIAGGSYHSVVMKGDGTLWGWGTNSNGELGNGTTTNSVVPVQVASLVFIPDYQAPSIPTNIKAVTVTDTQVSLSWTTATDNVGVTSYNIYNGATLVGTSAGTTYTVTGLTPLLTYSFSVSAKDAAGNSSSPSNAVSVTTRVADLTPPSTPLSVSVSSSGIASLTLSWNASTDNMGVIKQYMVYNGTTIVGTTTATMYKVTGLQPNNTYAYTIRAQDAAGNLSVESAKVTGTTLLGLFTGGMGNHSFVIKNDGSIWAWGNNGTGQYGNNTTTSSTSPLQIALTGFKTIVPGYDHSLGLKNDGTVWAWGYNGYGQLGNNTTTNSSIPVQVSNLTSVTSIASGQYFSLALKKDGTVWAWGYNANYQLGDTTTTTRLIPVQVSGLTGVTAIVAGGLHALVLKNDGSVWAWGYNGYGQLGNNTTTSSSIPMQVSGPSTTTAISAGIYHSIALRSDGTVWTWGYNVNGQLGNGNTTNSSIPVQASALSGITALAAGFYHNLALKNDGTVWGWGSNAYGQVGNGPSVDVLTPVKVTGLTNALTVGTGANHSLVMKSDGSVWTWGLNNLGQLGNTSTTNSFVPIQPNGLNLIGIVGTNGPSNLVIPQVRDTQISLLWTPSSVVYTNSTYKIFNGSTLMTSTTGSSVTLNNLTPNTSYTLSVQMQDASGNGIGTTDPLVITTPSQQSVLSVTNVTYGGMDLIVSDNNPATTQYQLRTGIQYVDQSGSLTLSPAWVTLPNKKISLTGLSGGNAYTFTAVARNQNGDLTALSNQVTATPLVVKPAIPTHVQAKAKSNAVTLSWDPVSNADGYEVEVDGTVVSTGTPLYFVHTPLASNSKHAYRVRATSGGVASDWSGINSITTLLAVASPPNLTIQALSTVISLSWSLVPGVLYDELEVDGAVKNIGANTTYIHKGLSPNTKHTYRIRTINVAGTGPWSTLSSVITAQNTPTVPIGITTDASDTNITLNWTDVADAQGYDVEADGIILDNGTSTYMTHSGMQPASTHAYRVRAKNSVGVSSWGATVTTATYLLQTPAQVTAVEDDTQIMLSWSAVPDATRYSLEVDGVAADIGLVTSFIKTGLPQESLHSFRVRAINATGQSGWSDTVQAMTLPSRPGIPAQFSATASIHAIQLSWAAVTGASGYDVELDDVLIDNFSDTQYLDSELDAYSGHHYRIRAKTNAVVGNWSPMLSVMTLVGPPTPPQNIVLASVSNIVYISWDAESAAIGYDIEVDGVVNNVGTKTSYTHRRVSVGTEHEYRLRARNKDGVSDWSGLITNNTITAKITKNKTVDLGLTSQDIVDFRSYTLTLVYDPKAMTVVDLSTLTDVKELTVGKIKGTDITITQFTPGRITFVTSKVVNPGESWTGVINSIQFKAKVSGGSAFTYTVYSAPDASNQQTDQPINSLTEVKP